MKKSICFYFQIHQPFRIDKMSFFDSETRDCFEGPENFKNKAIFEKVAGKCYIPMLDLLDKMMTRHPEFKIAFSISGVFLDQCENFEKTGSLILKKLQKLAATGRVEFLTETYFHSLSFLHSKLEFTEQCLAHHHKIKELFGQKPKIFRNTELIYSDELAEFVRNLGFRGILAEGWDDALNGENPNFVRVAKKTKLSPDDLEITKEVSPRNLLDYRKKLPENIKVLTKNYKLSDDIAFRFGNKDWAEHPLFAEKFAEWVDQTEGETINLFMDFETFGEHQWEDTGIFDFFEKLPEVLADKNIGFRTPTEAIEELTPVGEFSSEKYLSWADENRDISAWLENDLQKSAFAEISEIEATLHPYRDSKKTEIREIWYDFRRLQTSDHLYYMSTKYFADGDVHTYFSPFESPYEAFIYFMNALEALKKRINNMGN